MFSIRAIDWSDPRSKRIVIVCILLLLASAVNYMDRQTLAVASARIKGEFELSNVQYGRVEAVFGYSFAIGSLFWGFIVDRFSVRWVYPIGLLGWSAMGFLTGWARDYDDLFWCRLMLGFFESAHWPCGLKTTQALLSQKGRALGNSVLQSGTSIG
ncbi:MAG: MFS transporter, partial [Pirellula sp.]